MLNISTIISKIRGIYEFFKSKLYSDIVESFKNKGYDEHELEFYYVEDEVTDTFFISKEHLLYSKVSYDDYSCEESFNFSESDIRIITKDRKLIGIISGSFDSWDQYHHLITIIEVTVPDRKNLVLNDPDLHLIIEQMKKDKIAKINFYCYIKNSNYFFFQNKHKFLKEYNLSKEDFHCEYSVFDIYFYLKNLNKPVTTIFGFSNGFNKEKEILKLFEKFIN